jgi:phosphoribosylamine--glycine ligase
MEEIIRPTAVAMAKAGTPFNGVLYAGLMLTSDGPKLIEYNVRFGDPECEAIMPRVEGDFAALLYGVATGTLVAPSLSDDTTMTVVVAASGYPGTPKAGGAISGLDAAEEIEGVTVFQAGTKIVDGQLVASGGRVLAVTAKGRSLGQARERVYQAVDAIDFADGFHRRDIGWRELERAV